LHVIYPSSQSDFAATRTSGIDSPSEVGSTPSVPSHLSTLVSSSYVDQNRSRLSPVSEGHGTDESHDDQPHSADTEFIDSHFEIVKPPPPPPNQIVVAIPPRLENRRRGASISQPIIEAPLSEMTFSRQPVPPSHPQVSALSKMLASSGGSSNPFSELYAAISGRGESAAMDVKIFFPQARQPRGEAMVLSVRKDATVEEVIGFALWSYWEESWLPKLDEGVNENDLKLAAVGWVMRIAEDDGEVDEDFPRKYAMSHDPEFSQSHRFPQPLTELERSPNSTWMHSQSSLQLLLKVRPFSLFLFMLN